MAIFIIKASINICYLFSEPKLDKPQWFLEKIISDRLPAISLTLTWAIQYKTTIASK